MFQKKVKPKIQIKIQKRNCKQIANFKFKPNLKCMKKLNKNYSNSNKKFKIVNLQINLVKKNFSLKKCNTNKQDFLLKGIINISTINIK